MKIKLMCRLMQALTLWLVLWVELCSITYSSATSRRQCHFPAIFNFGDSNSDTGGLSAAFGQTGAPEGETYFHHPAGRYSDGRLIIDFIAEKLGLPYLSPFLDSVGSNFRHGANFATAGSTIRPQNTTLRQAGGFSPFSLDVQFTQFNDFQRRSQLFRNKGGVYEKFLPKAKAFSRALYTFDIGQNDLGAGYFLNMSTDQIRAYVPDVLAQFNNTIKYVYGQGGRSFWIHNTGPLGCLPYMLGLPQAKNAKFDNAGCAIPHNEVAQFFNRELKATVVQLRKELALAAITYVDVYSVKYSLISQPKNHGFAEPLRPCRCGQGGKTCKDPSVRVNWDGVHYTEAANKWVFSKIEDGSFSDPPIPLKMACHKKM